MDKDINIYNPWNDSIQQYTPYGVGLYNGALAQIVIDKNGNAALASPTLDEVKVYRHPEQNWNVLSPDYVPWSNLTPRQRLSRWEQWYGPSGIVDRMRKQRSVDTNIGYESPLKEVYPEADVVGMYAPMRGILSNLLLNKARKKIIGTTAGAMLRLNPSREELNNFSNRLFQKYAVRAYPDVNTGHILNKLHNIQINDDAIMNIDPVKYLTKYNGFKNLNDYQKSLMLNIDKNAKFSAEKQVPQQIKDYLKAQVVPRIDYNDTGLQSEDVTLWNNAQKDIADDIINYSNYVEIPHSMMKRTGSGGFYYWDLGKIALDKKDVNFAAGHEVRHKIDALIPLSGKHDNLLKDAYWNDDYVFDSYPDVYTTPERVTTNFDTRNKLFDMLHMPELKTASLDKLNAAIENATDDLIWNALRNSNGYGDDLYNSIFTNNIFPGIERYFPHTINKMLISKGRAHYLKNKVNAIRMALKTVPALSAPYIISTNKQSTDKK